MKLFISRGTPCASSQSVTAQLPEQGAIDRKYEKQAAASPHSFWISESLWDSVNWFKFRVQASFAPKTQLPAIYTAERGLAIENQSLTRWGARTPRRCSVRAAAPWRGPGGRRGPWFRGRTRGGGPPLRGWGTSRCRCSAARPYPVRLSVPHRQHTFVSLCTTCVYLQGTAADAPPESAAVPFSHASDTHLMIPEKSFSKLRTSSSKLTWSGLKMD